jgi:hypothetical protein
MDGSPGSPSPETDEIVVNLPTAAPEPCAQQTNVRLLALVILLNLKSYFCMGKAEIEVCYSNRNYRLICGN